MAKQGSSVEASLQRFEQGRHWWCRGGSGCLKSSSDSGSDWRNQTAECFSHWDSFPMIPLSAKKVFSTDNTVTQHSLQFWLRCLDFNDFQCY